MPPTSRASRAESSLDAVILRPGGQYSGGDSRVPHFALIETRGPDPRAFFLSPLILATLLSSSVVLGRLPTVRPAPLAEDVTLLVAPPEPLTLPDVSAMKSRSETSPPLLTAPKAAKVDVQRPRLHSAPVRIEPVTSDSIAAKPDLPEMTEKSRPASTQPERAALSNAAPVVPAVIETPKDTPAAPAASAVTNVVAHDLKQAPADPSPGIAGDITSRIPSSLGGLPLSQLLDDQEGLAAGLAALPSTERRSLPRVSIRVNAEWLAALPKTQERLYFSITTPQPDREVLAYLPDSHSFELERPEHPLWQIHDGDRVPALAELRAEAGRWLGVSPELVGLYTWHPPVFEDALRMFVLERMQELRVHLGPRDLVTVRLAPGAEGTVMSLEPIHQESSIN
jgi:hypothetical protein